MDGDVYVTTRVAAELAGMAPDRFRSEMTRERARGRDHRAPESDWPDGRTPLWDRAGVQDWLERRHPRGPAPTGEPSPSLGTEPSSGQERA